MTIKINTTDYNQDEKERAGLITHELKEQTLWSPNTYTTPDLRLPCMSTTFDKRDVTADNVWQKPDLHAAAQIIQLVRQQEQEACQGAPHFPYSGLVIWRAQWR